MSGTALALVLTAAVLHALWNLAAKRWGGGPHFVLAGALGVAILWAPVVAIVGWQEFAQWPAIAWWAVLASALLHLFYFNALLAGYQASDLNIVYPVARGSGPAVSSLGAILVLNEPLSLSGALGLTAIVSGIVLMAAGPALLHADDAGARQRRRLGIAWGALTGLLIAGYTLVDGYAVKVLLISPLLVDWAGNVLRIPFALMPVLRDPGGFMPALKRQWRGVLVLAVLSPLAYILVLYALRLAPLSHVAPARELSMLVAALLGGQLLKEGEKHWRLVGAACIATGVVALAL